MERETTDHHWYWMRWQVPVCALIFLIPTMASLKLIKHRGKGKVQMKRPDLWVPCWRNMHPRWLLYYRVTALLAMAFVLYQTVLAFGFFVFFFYTQWTFALVMVYFTLAILISFRGCSIHPAKPFAEDKFLRKNSQESIDDDHAPTSKETRDPSSTKYQVSELPAPFWGNLMEHVYQACAGAVMLTDIVFWCLILPFLSDEHFQLTLLIGFMHSINAVFLIIDSALNSLPFPWFGMVYFVLWSSCYVVFQWAAHACCFTWWPYPFLDLSNSWAPMWYLAMALVHIPCYGLYVGLVNGKEYICSRMFAGSYLRLH